jgi:hypothetical protein
MININMTRPIIIVGKTGTGKTTKALEILGDNPIIRYANEYDIEDNFSIPIDRGILIEEANYKPKLELIVNTINQYQGQVVLTSLNQKDVPKGIFGLCKLKRAGTKNYYQVSLSEDLVGSQDPVDYDKNIFELFYDYLRNKDRNDIVIQLKLNKPYDEQFLSWLALNIHPNKIAYLDAKVKRRWSQSYFYELLAYAHKPSSHSHKAIIPQRKARPKIIDVCRKLGLRPYEHHLIKQLIQDDGFAKYASKTLNNYERRMLHLPEPPRKKKVLTHRVATLGDF